MGILGYMLLSEQSAITDGLAMYFLGARVLRSVCPIIAVSTPLVVLRAGFFTVHNIIAMLWLVKLMAVG